MAETADFFSGLSMVVKGLVEASKSATYALGFGAFGAAASSAMVGVTSLSGVLCTVGAFFVSVKIGSRFDAPVGARPQLPPPIVPESQKALPPADVGSEVSRDPLLESSKSKALPASEAQPPE